MKFSPLLLSILLTVFCLTGAGCSSPAPEARDTSLQVTPKPYVDDEGQGGLTKIGKERYAFSGSAYGLAWNDYIEWSQEEIKAASFIHSANVYFHFDSSVLTETAKQVLRQKADKIKAFPQFYVVIAGHGDERGSDEYNMGLGDRRAQAAYKYLLSLGVPARQLTTISYGKMYPANNGSGEDFWSLNRRDEFFVSKQN